MQMSVDSFRFTDIDVLNQVSEHIRREFLDPFVFPGCADELLQIPQAPVLLPKHE